MANRLQTDTAMSVSSLPVEILEDILQDMISEYKKRTKLKVLPPWYLASLLRVCKLWNMVYESYLYRSISIGRLFSHDTLRIRGNSDGRQIEIAGKLIRTFSANPRLAALVEEFELMAEGVQAPKWSRTAARLIDLCPNLQHVKLEGLGPDMTMSLKKRSLVSFRIDAKRHSGYSSFPIYELMRQWPRLQTIRIDGVYNLWLRARERSFSPTSLASSALNCCSELREINLTGGFLTNIDLRALRLMCSGVARLAIYVDVSDDAALIGCLRAWSQTLQCVKLRFRGSYSPRPQLSEALSDLRSLAELQISGFEIDFSGISDLPQLKRLYYNAIITIEALNHVANLLKS